MFEVGGALIAPEGGFAEGDQPVAGLAERLDVVLLFLRELRGSDQGVSCEETARLVASVSRG